jgi:hypothetical protein
MKERQMNFFSRFFMYFQREVLILRACSIRQFCSTQYRSKTNGVDMHPKMPDRRKSNLSTRDRKYLPNKQRL